MRKIRLGEGLFQMEHNFEYNNQDTRQSRDRFDGNPRWCAGPLQLSYGIQMELLRRAATEPIIAQNLYQGKLRRLQDNALVRL